MFKIIFLDIDGVLNHEKWYHETIGNPEVGNRGDIDPKCMEILNTIIKRTGAKIVISSTWRFDNNCNKKLYYAGLIPQSIIDVTINLCHFYDYCVRGNEIFEYTKKHNITNYIILDDDSDMLFDQKDNFIHIDSFVGVTEKNVIEAIKILNKE